LEEFDHFLPSADTFENDPRVKIIELGWHHQNFYTVTGEEVRKRFEGFDFLIGTDYAPAYLMKARMSLDIFFPAGGDIFDYPFRKLSTTKWLPEIYQIEAWRCAIYQRWSVALCGAISMDPAHEDLEKYLRILHMDKLPRIPAVPFLYTKQYTEDYFLKSNQYEFIKKLREENDLLIVQHCRQSWTCDKSDLNYKANELLMEGFAAFCKANPKVKIRLLLLEYGLDIQATKDLLEKLSISSQVTWFPKMLRKDLMTILKYCDAGVGELGRSWFSYGAVYEILAVQVPFIGNRNDEDYQHRLPELYPMLNATSSKEIEECLIKVRDQKESLRLESQKANEWLRKYAIGKCLDQILEIIGDKQRVKKIPLFLRIKLLGLDLFVKIIVGLNILHLQFNKITRLSMSKG
jgi:hypothetical protein